MLKYFIYIFIILLLGCSMNSKSNNINNINKVSNVKFKINKTAGVKIND